MPTIGVLCQQIQSMSIGHCCTEAVMIAWPDTHYTMQHNCILDGAAGMPGDGQTLMPDLVPGPEPG